jgi:hypothetical protein
MLLPISVAAKDFLSNELACEKLLDTMLAEYDTLSYIPFSVQKNSYICNGITEL